MPFYSTEHRGNRASSDLLSTWTLAGACNADFRFKAAGWIETPASVELLVLDKLFSTTLNRLMPNGAGLPLETVIASVYGCRVKERGIPRRRG